MTSEQKEREAWKASHSAQKQSNYGKYKAGVHRGEGMGFQSVTITADTPEIALEIAHMVETASRAHQAQPEGELVDCDCGRGPAKYKAIWPHGAESLTCDDCMQEYEYNAQEVDAHEASLAAQGYPYSGGCCPRPQLTSLSVLPPQPDAQPDSGWRPMESAPKDGTRFLAWYGAKYLQQEVVARWSNRQECFVDWAEEAIEGEIKLTLWQPLPASPSGSSGSEKEGV